ncbi:MAG TPA: DNA translocase FtsK 4TM domain-containing protein, partial [Burkholderiales bacterium]|nr:DNA translocase FtsK 4TM domain-containing protein [Burkholderiales bacterium]
MARSRAETAPPSASPPRIAGLIRESWWLLLVGASIYLLLVLVTYHKGDPAWSVSATSDVVRNAGGRLGAWLSDILLYLFGISAYWFVLFLLNAVRWGYGRLESASFIDRRSVAVAGVGFVLLVCASAAIEHLRLHSLTTPLPLAPGGIIGTLLGDWLRKGFGFIGSTLFLLMLALIGFSLFTGLSWVRFMERLGGWMEEGYAWASTTYRAWQDRRAGTVAVVRREEVVEVVKKKIVEEHEPLRIEPPVVEIPRSERVERERQVPLFEDLPDSPLPPIALLDAAAKEVEMLSPETLEFTSRLIEKKLLDFGVEVQVQAAYPGPVITRYEIEPAVGVKGSQIVNLVKDLARALSVVSIRVVETIPGKSCMGLEIPNPKRQIVRLSEIVSSEVYAD